jgi:hypothetical protein
LFGAGVFEVDVEDGCFVKLCETNWEDFQLFLVNGKLRAIGKGLFRISMEDWSWSKVAGTNWDRYTIIVI